MYVSCRVTDNDNSLESSTLASAGLFLDRFDLAYLDSSISMTAALEARGSSRVPRPLDQEGRSPLFGI